MVTITRSSAEQYNKNIDFEAIHLSTKYFLRTYFCAASLLMVSGRLSLIINCIVSSNTSLSVIFILSLSCS